MATPSTFGNVFGRITADQAHKNAVLTLQQKYRKVSGDIEEEIELNDGDLSPACISHLLLTQINGSADLPEQRVTVEYLRNSQRMLIPSPMGMAMHAVQDNPSICTVHPEIRLRYLRVCAMSFNDIHEVVTQSENYVAIREVVAQKAPVTRTDALTPWEDPAWHTIDTVGLVSNETYEMVMATLSAALQFNCDIRDTGYLLRADATVTDVMWKDTATMTHARIQNKLQPYTLACIAALNLPSVNNYGIAAWVRAYGLGFGIYPHRSSATVKESIFTLRPVTSAMLEPVNRVEDTYGATLPAVCANLLAIFGLLHLSKDHTIRSGDPNMDRIGNSYLQTLRTQVPKETVDDLTAHREEVLRTGPHPFGLAQTYWFAQALHMHRRLTPALDIRHNATPPPVQRIHIILAGAEEWEGLPAGMEVSDAYFEQLQVLRAAEAQVRAEPPAFSELYRLYGLTSKATLAANVLAATKAMMPVVYGFAVVAHTSDDSKKDGLALALSLTNVERDAKGQALAWQNAWENYITGMDKIGLIEFIRQVTSQRQRA